jgi:predicted Zn-dependent protease
LEEAGIPLQGTHDLVVLTGVPVHEIFGHHFEEPINYLTFGESGTFQYNQDILNKEIVLSDNPGQQIEGFEVGGFTYFDAYGRVREPRTHIKDGKVLEFLGSEYIDQEKLKRFLNLNASNFVGNAGQYIDGAFPQPRMSCTVLDGASQRIDLEGKLVIVPNNGRTNPQEKTYMLDSFECYVIKDAQPLRVIPLTITGAIHPAMTEMVLLDDLNYSSGNCGKPNPIGEGQASMPVSQLTKSQLWKNQQVFQRQFSDLQFKKLTKR